MNMENVRKVRIPEVAVRRLPLYLRVLTELRQQGERIVASSELSRHTGYSSEQIRKDFAYFGAFGTRGVGYETDVLIDRIRATLGLEQPIGAALIGAGNLGTALGRYHIEHDHDIRIRAIFDNDPRKIGRTVAGRPIQPMEVLPDVIRREGIRLAIIAVPAAAAREVARLVVRAGVRVLLNFAPIKLGLKEDVHVQDIDLGLELQSLAYYVARSREGPETK